MARYAFYFAVLALLATSCASEQGVAPQGTSITAVTASDVATTDRHSARSLAETSFEGEIGPGARYFLHVPESWNGDLVLYAHGYTAPMFPVGVPPGEEVLVEGMRTIALQSGFAFAYSTYSETGFAVKDAAQRTEQLLHIFGSRVEPPRRTLLVGTSFGGLVMLKLLESSENYAGGLALCGMLGGARAQIDYFAHVRVLFDYFYPGVMPGSLYKLPESVDLENDLIPALVRAIVAQPEGAFAIAQIDQAPLPFSSPDELALSIVQALVFFPIGLEDLLDRTHGQGFFDNTHTVYTGNLPPELLADLNARVDRYSQGPAAAQVIEKYYEPSGDLRVPLVTLHTSMDPVVPLSLEEIYRDKVESRGRGGNLHQTTIPRYGHCLFTPEELVAGFSELVLRIGPAPSAAVVAHSGTTR